jgi:hypothetical protein
MQSCINKESNMSKFSIELPATLVVAMRNGASVTVNTADIQAVATELFIYGVNQKLRDSASGATKAAEAEGSQGVQAEAQAMMDSALAALVAGEWSMRGEGGGGTDPRVLIGRSLVRKAIKDKVGAKSPAWAKFTGLSDAEQLAKLDENLAANEELFAPLIDAELKRRADAAKAKANASKAVEISL